MGKSLARIGFRAAALLPIAAITACSGRAPANQSSTRSDASARFPADVIAIREAADAYLKTHRAEALSHVPADWAPLVPDHAGEPTESADPGYLLPPWRLRLDRNRAALRYTPREGVTEHDRFWFEIGLEKTAETWRISGDGLVFGHAWRRE
ncbi:MAG TPA: hypothetical protein VFQ35_07325 [Polyangiaceae bacterium]|nr:hypothetical protein [Polyangiaceae bacterium]